MKKYLLLRGHQGSGKSTFARQKMEEFRRQYPDALIVHLENDLEMMENGVYRWSPENFARAEKRVAAKKREAFAAADRQAYEHILMVNSNTNQKALNCQKMLKEARRHGFQTEVYRLHGFFANQHRVPAPMVLNAYLKLNENPLREEIHLPPPAPPAPELQALLERMKRFDFRRLPYDEARHTYISEDYLLCGRAHYRENFSTRFPELRVLKYQNKVFYENRFDRALLEMRGLVLDRHNQIIVRPFDKCFNYSERTAPNSPFPLHLDDERRLDVVVKVNGFLGCCTSVELPPDNPSATASFNGQILYSTTGSLDSDFSRLVEKHCAPRAELFRRWPNHTFLFEINDPSDPHIIAEAEGITLIGLRRVSDGHSYSEDELDRLAAAEGLRRPERINAIRFADLKTLLANVRHEGFMVRDAASGEVLCKLKSPYYLLSKLFARTRRLEDKLDKRQMDEEYYPLIDHINAHRDRFNGLNEQEKIKFIQDFFHDYLLHL